MAAEQVAERAAPVKTSSQPGGTAGGVAFSRARRDATQRMQLLSGSARKRLRRSWGMRKSWPSQTKRCPSFLLRRQLLRQSRALGWPRQAH